MKYFEGLIEDSKDALIVIEAAKQGILALIDRRLSHDERKSIKPGSCFVWEQERNVMQRWTDGMSWSTSRYYKNFFTYYERADNNVEPKLKSDLLMKRTFTIEGIDGRKFQLINYLNIHKPLNKKLTRPGQTSLAKIAIPSDYYIKKHTFSKKAKAQVKVKTSEVSYSQDLTSDISSAKQSTNSVPGSPTSNLRLASVSLSYSNQSSILNNSIHLMECSLSNLLYEEDQRQLSLLKVTL